MSESDLDRTLEFLKEHRGNEANYQKIRQKLDEEISRADAEGPAGYGEALRDIAEGGVPAYESLREKGATAYPEFEKIVNAFEKAVMDAKP